ncbi:MAG: NAD(P)H-hydrate dehydratase [Lentisphaerae bacterium]|nr:NAD(P)H-hydrate dehydratase [Lentisphaerota bacterium]
MDIISVDDMRRMDALAISSGSANGFTLMDRAGKGAAEHILRYLEGLPPQQRRRIIALAGKGNNGGDAWVVARVLYQQGLAVELYSCCRRDELPPDARLHAALLPAAIPCREAISTLPGEALQAGCVIIDGLLGTGLHGAPREPYRRIIEQVNAGGLPVVALDIPSGLDGDSGAAECAINADLTLTMAFPKTGLVRGDGPRHCGPIHVIDIGLPPSVTSTAQSLGRAFTQANAAPLLGRRDPAAHKNSLGHVLCVAGSRQYAGAAALCAGAALRSGAGLVTLAYPAAMPRPPAPHALIYMPLGDAQHDNVFSDAMITQLGQALPNKNALVYGPGSSPTATPGVLRALLAATTPMVIDADGLRLLAAQPELLDAAQAELVLTPHPGEMAALLRGLGLADALQADRREQAMALAVRSRAVVVLKGQHTVVAAPNGQEPTINLSGTAALATAGTGDVLAGMIGAMLAQGMKSEDAARCAVFIHGLCAECWHGAQRALIADDVVALIAKAMHLVAPRA